MYIVIIKHAYFLIEEFSMNPAIIKFAAQTASVIASTIISYCVIVTIEHTVEGIRRWYHKKNETSETSN